MKILNSDKRNVIAAEAKVALSVPIIEVSAEGRVNIAKSNINTNAETTIQVSWSGGGHIRDANEQWNVDSLIRAAARFPDLVANSPQRIYAILTKYNTLRSFIALGPPNATPLDYETAKLYTNALMDSYMAYKSLYQEVSTAITDLSSGAKRFKPAIAGASNQLPEDPDGLDMTPFPPSTVGLDRARREIRRQMGLITDEVRKLTNNPVLASDPKHKDPCQTPVSFNARLPVVEAPRQLASTPLSGQEILPDPVVEDPGAPELFSPPGNLTADETTTVNTVTAKQPSLSQTMRLTAPVGDFSAGNSFCFLDYLHEDAMMYSFKVEFFQGACIALTTTYTIGLVVVRGRSSRNSSIFELSGFANDHFIAGSIETGTPTTGADKSVCITTLKLFTNRGRSLVATAKEDGFTSDNSALRDGVEYTGLTTTTVDSPLKAGFIKGFWGRSNEKRNSGRIYRLGFVWGDVVAVSLILLKILSRMMFDSPVQTGQASIEREEAPVYSATSGLITMTGSAAVPAGQTKDVQVSFFRIFTETPRILHGLKTLDIEVTNNTPRFYSRLSDPSLQGFRTTFDAPNSAPTVYGNYLTLPKNDIHSETGIFNTSVLYKQITENVKQRINFAQELTAPPTVRCWIQGPDATSTFVGDYNLSISATGITNDAFTLAASSTKQFTSVIVGWLAYDSKEDGKRVQCGSVNITDSNAQRRSETEVTFTGTPFAKVPASFIGCNSYTVGEENWVRWKSDVVEVTKEKIKVACGCTANPTSMLQYSYVWIVME